VATVILVDPEYRLYVGGYSEEVHQVYAGAFPVSPGISEFVDTKHTDIALDRVLSGPDTGSGSPLPGEEVLAGCLEDAGLEAEYVLIIGSEAAAGVLDYIESVIPGLGKVCLCLFR
jgi:hypothetical protein